MLPVLRHFRIWTSTLILLATLTLVAIGCLSIHAAQPEQAYKQMLFALLGLGLLLLLQSVHYQLVGRLAWLLHLLILGCILYTLLPFVPASGFGGVPTINGARNWIDFVLIRFQPAEVAKVSFVLTLAWYLQFRESQKSYAGLIAPFLMTLIPMVMILRQPDLGTTIVFIPVLFAMLFAAGARAGHLLSIAAAGVLCLPLIWFSGNPGTPVLERLPEIVKPFQRARVQAMWRDDPHTLQRTGFQQHNALMALGSGGPTGKGLGNIEIGRRVPENHNDMIFALIGEQLGAWGALLVLLTYALFVLAGIEIAGSTRDPFGRLVALGLTALLASSAILNLLVVLRLMPVTGVTLPFISYGGSSLLTNFLLAGLLINISNRRPIVLAPSKFEDSLARA